MTGRPDGLPRPRLAIAVVLGLVYVVWGSTGEWHGFSVAQVGGRAAWALVYLIFVGSLVGFTAYIWVLRAAPLALVGTYAFVNLLVALLLGSLFGAERLTPQVAGGAALVVAAVAGLLVPVPRKG